MSTDDLEFDVIVLGGGMGGMSAAAYAASRGASVCVIEKAAEIGGSALLSGGWVWTAPTFEALREHAPAGDPELQRVFIQRFPRAIDWIRSTGIDMSEERIAPPGWGKGYLIDILAYLRRCAAIVETAQGWVLRSTVTDRLIVEDGRVQGVVACDAHGIATVCAPTVVLATGGFQGDRSLLYEQFGENSRQILLRSNPHSTGDGLRLGRAAGADIAGDLSSFYGHVIAWPLIEFGPKDFLRLSLSSFSLVGLLVNLSCERFTDESFAHQANAVATAKQPHARAALLVDDAGCSRALENSGATTLDDSAAGEARRAGARVATSLTMEGIGRSLTEWGFDVSRLPSTIETYNAMIRRGSTDGEPGRRWNRYPFGAGPYVAFEVRPGITATQGGLRVDASSRVLDRRGQPIPGLFAVGADAGGFYNGGWAGGLSVACVFAMVAVETALQTAPPDGPRLPT